MRYFVLMRYFVFFVFDSSKYRLVDECSMIHVCTTVPNVVFGYVLQNQRVNHLLKRKRFPQTWKNIFVHVP